MIPNGKKRRTVSSANDATTVYPVDPIRDIDLSPFLTRFFGWAPCCCCLYSPILDEEENQQEMVTNAFPVNKNALLVLLTSFLHGMADSMWSGAVLSLYIFELDNNRSSCIGYLEATHVFGSIIFLLLSTWTNLIGGLSKSAVLKVGGSLFILTGGLSIGMVAWVGSDTDASEKQTKIASNVVLPLMALWGIGSAAVTGATQKIYVVSTPEEDWQRYKSILFFVYVASSTIGPLLSIIIFESLVISSSIFSLYVVLLTGVSLELLVGMLCFLFSDAYILEGSSPRMDEGEDPEGKGRSSNKSNEIEKPLLQTVAESSAEAASVNTTKVSECSEEVGSVIVPAVLFVASILTSTGGGLLVKNFPLYFRTDVKFSLSEIQALYASVPPAVVLFTSAAKRISLKLGRIPTTMLMRGMGVLGIFVMSHGSTLMNNSGIGLSLTFVLRTAFMNSTYSVEESVKDEFCNTKRGLWTKLEVLNMVALAGSAAVGGIIVDDRNDYSLLLSIAGYIQAAGVTSLLLILPIVPSFQYSGDELDSES